MNSHALPKCRPFKLRANNITENTICHEYVLSIVTAAGKKLGYQFIASKYFSLPNLITLYEAQIRPSLEDCSHIWVTAVPTTLSILDAVQKRAIRLIGEPALTCHHQPLSHQRAVGDFYDLHNFAARCTRGTSSFHPKAVILHLCPQSVYGLKWTAW
nr:unnamed protein product [Callosobruchus chinensis]